jgi:hypothetical protein
MIRYPVPSIGVASREVRLEVVDVSGLARSYASLGLRVVGRRRDCARIELPCGVVLVLSRRSRCGVAA